jgi:hypothetical protein
VKHWTPFTPCSDCSSAALENFWNFVMTYCTAIKTRAGLDPITAPQEKLI